MLTHVGLVLRDEASVTSVPIARTDVAPDTLFGQFAGRWNEVLDSRKPVEAEYVFVTEAGYRVFCRGVLLPLSSSVSEIDHIYGVISWKSEKLFANDCRAFRACCGVALFNQFLTGGLNSRSDERRVGKEGVSTCSAGGAP